jgi:hypothetical protein
MAIIAAMKKVLSPSSEKMIIISDEKKASEETHTHTHTDSSASYQKDTCWDTIFPAYATHDNRLISLEISLLSQVSSDLRNPMCRTHDEKH